MSLSIDEVKLECLRLAIQNSGDCPVDAELIVKNAYRFFEFLQDRVHERPNYTDSKD